VSKCFIPDSPARKILNYAYDHRKSAGEIV
jgi:hypothetical protein